MEIKTIKKVVFNDEEMNALDIITNISCVNFIDECDNCPLMINFSDEPRCFKSIAWNIALKGG